jgi:hypothetical protein
VDDVKKTAEVNAKIAALEEERQEHWEVRFHWRRVLRILYHHSGSCTFFRLTK